MGGTAAEAVDGWRGQQRLLQEMPILKNRFSIRLFFDGLLSLTSLASGEWEWQQASGLQ